MSLRRASDADVEGKGSGGDVDGGGGVSGGSGDGRGKRVKSSETDPVLYEVCSTAMSTQR